MKVLRALLVIPVLALLFLLIPTVVSDSGAPEASAEVIYNTAYPDSTDALESAEVLNIDDVALLTAAGEALEDEAEEVKAPDAPAIGSHAVIGATKVRLPLDNGGEDIRCKLEYSTDKDFSDYRTRNYKTSKGFITVNRLEPDTTYYFRLQYYIIDSQGKKHYSYFSCNKCYTTNTASLTLGKSSVEIKFGKTKRVKATLDGSAHEIVWKSDDEYVATVDVDGRITGVHPGRTTVTATVPDLGLSESCQVHIKGLVRVALTFDDGPGAYTAGLLDFLKKTPAKVTFFLIGQQISSYSETVARMVAEGHEVGNHTYTHVQLTKCSADKMKDELNKNAKAYKKATGLKPTVMRPPYGSKNDTLLGILDVPCITWNVDTLDWKYRDADRNVQQLLNGAKDGNIILMHDIHKTSVEGAERAIPKLLDKGVEFVTVTELLTKDGKKPTAGKCYFSGK